MIPPAKNEVIRGCIIDNVEFRDAYDHLTFDILGEQGKKLDTIQVCNREIREDLELLLANPVRRLFWAFAMTDIDIYWADENSLSIEVSPYAGVYTTYIVNKSELEKLLNE